jgi:LysM repeat protein
MRNEQGSYAEARSRLVKGKCVKTGAGFGTGRVIEARTAGAGGWVCRLFFLAALWFYASVTLSTVTARLRADREAAVHAAAAANAAFGVGGASYTDPVPVSADGVSYPAFASAPVPADGVARENAAFVLPVPVQLEPEEYSSAQPVRYSYYRIQQGDIIGVLAQNYGLNQDTLISVNDIKNTRTIRQGVVLRIPNQDGIAYTVRASDTVVALAEKYGIDYNDILTVNEYFSTRLMEGDTLFLPGARLDPAALQEINGDLFIWPTSNRFVTSAYGWRISPITRTRLFHFGIDIRGNTGAPVYAAMAGRVSYTGYNATYGDHIVITHHSGYRTLYGHLNVIRVKSGAYVSTGQRIGDVGNGKFRMGQHFLGFLYTPLGQVFHNGDAHFFFDQNGNIRRVPPGIRPQIL